MRQFVVSCIPDKNGNILLNEKEQRYLFNVLRLKTGNKIDVSFPDGTMATMQINSAKLELVNQPVKEISLCEENPSNGPDFFVFQFLPKGPKMDLIVRQSTECGVSVIIPIIGEYSILGKKQDSLKENKNKVERWARIIREARQQCGSKIATKIESPCTLDEAMSFWNNACEKQKKGFVLRERDERQESIFTLLGDIEDIKNCKIGMAIGCEGGISPREIEILEKNGFLPIHLKTNILRAETATLYSIAVLQSAIMEASVWKK